MLSIIPGELAVEDIQRGLDQKRPASERKLSAAWTAVVTV